MIFITGSLVLFLRVMLPRHVMCWTVSAVCCGFICVGETEFNGSILTRNSLYSDASTNTNRSRSQGDSGTTYNEVDKCA